MNETTEPVSAPDLFTPVPQPYMWCSAEVDKVCAALAKAQAIMPAIPLDSTNPFYKSKYASLGSVISETREILGKFGLAIVQIPSMEGTSITVQTRILHESGQWIDGGSLQANLNEEDRRSLVQLAGSFITYMRRYSRMALLQLYADEDNDGNTQQKPAQTQQRTTPTQQTTTAAQQKPTATPEEQKEKWDRIRLKLLNKLRACPGQEHRELITRYLISKAWILEGQGPEEWPTAHIPLTEESAGELFANIGMFERQQMEKAKTEDNVPF